MLGSALAGISCAGVLHAGRPEFRLSGLVT